MSVQANVTFQVPISGVTGNISIPYGKFADRVVSVQVISQNATQSDVTSQFAATLPADGEIDCTDTTNINGLICMALLARGQ